jgi:OFA family oxalate/formate antiporter-like MFS transporter
MSKSHLQTTLTITGCLLITFCMGSIHAFSTLIEAIELQTGVERIASSLVYSFGLISVTLAVFFGHALYHRFSAFTLIFIAALLPVAGILLTNTETWLGWLLGYGIFFGFSSGLGYGFSLHACTLVTKDSRRGLVLGAVTGAYALGAVVFSIIYPALLASFSLDITYSIATVIISTAVGAGALLLLFSKVKTKLTDLKPQNKMKPTKLRFSQLWAGYYFGVFAGLMVIGHAVPIIKTMGVGSQLASSGIVLMSLGSGIAGLIAGYIADQFGCRKPLSLLAITSAISLVLLALLNDVRVVLVLMVCIATLYGAFIAIYPTMIANIFGKERSAWAYGKVFTAWGFAGLSAPLLASWLYQQNNSYNIALLTAALLAALSAMMVFSLPNKQPKY